MMCRFSLFLVSFLFIGCSNGSHLSYLDQDVDRDRIGTLSSTEIGNGGDLIECIKSGGLFPFDQKNNWYVLDYAEFIDDITYYDFHRAIEYFQKVRSTIARAGLIPLNSFDNFMNQVPFFDINFNGSRSSVERLWAPKKKNEKVYDEGTTHIAPNCRMGEDNMQINLHQVVVREAFYNEANELVKVIYNYDPQLMGFLEDKPLQLSMLIVHEWLWDYFEPHQSSFLRQFNRELHGDHRTLSSKYLREKLNL